MRNMTVAELYEACMENRYLLLRFASGYQMGINCKIAPLARKKIDNSDDSETDFVSYIPCDLITYIQHKHPFY